MPTGTHDVQPLARLLKALADPTRLRVVAALAQGELCVCHLEAVLELPQPTVSRQLAILRAAGIVADRREGTWVHYRLAPLADPAAARVMRALADASDVEPALQRRLRRVRRERGPQSCR
jgi:ArsR family transcriptional regulator